MNTASILRLSRDAQQRISRSCRYKLRVFRSGIHRLGVRAAQNIPAGRKIIEYAGEKIARAEARRRFIQGSPGRSRKQHYLARLDPYWTIDGAVGGSGAELINHACDPNLRLKKFRGRLWLFSLRQIRTGEELGFDYQFAKNGERIICRCGSTKCRGTINCT
jgi:uncharacterized protein